MDIATASPAEIDGRLATIYGDVARLRDQRDQAQATIERIDSVQDSFEREYPWNSQAKRDAAEVEIVAASEKIHALTAEARPMQARYDAERWTRFYWVTNTGGHIHWTTGCDTCFPTTGFAWMTDYSGMSHADLVQEAGSVACTVCFPDAPVDVLSRATRLELPERKARREAKEAKAAAAAAAAVVVPNYIEYSGRPSAKTFKTERAATNAIASDLGSLCWYGTGHPSAQKWLSNIKGTRDALAEKGVDYDYDKALAAARKKVTKEGCAAKF